ncbi:SGNH/GDSL hydrolase family protein [Aestuariicella sp. G3-2]|uniref:SGNH/GDSL hydrolase family protein n=1 Tax=Pseudomaricurvus albidus TaxID=2842452 RepID=UPI001C0C51D6|nr:SGNH/GDSL hydrolase family protein [Aestuariicella albida]MBU3069429.1 SGNH/GDSL hydrolase family protein [Aestuariicella albida]
MTDTQWHALPDSRFPCHGVAVRTECYHRLPQSAYSDLPAGVVEQARFPAGVRLRFTTNSPRLLLRCQAFSPSKDHGIDCLVDGVYWRTLLLKEGETTEYLVFQGLPEINRQIELYLPHEQEVDLQAIGLTSQAEISEAEPYVDELPLVFYGSSIVQGAGAHLSSMSYPAIISRHLNRDFINLGFYGAGRGEPEVVKYVANCPASVLILDLGKSYGRQPVEVYLHMLKQLRKAQPETPIVAITPIFSSRECFEPRFYERSEMIRDVMRRAAKGFDNLMLVEGEALLGETDWPGLSVDGLHPNEKGYDDIARRLLQVLKKCLAT